ncbi:MAG TPA: hypothetical protein VGD65_24380 [Chryseosolibacter sp.]
MNQCLTNMRVVFSVLSVIILVACTSNDLAIAPAEGILNKPATGKEDQSVIYQLTSDESLRIHIKTIEDSRCPADVQCISAGYVKVAFEIENVGEAELITPVLPGSNASDTYEFSLGGKNYRLVLEDVIPFPTTKNYLEPRSVEFLLEQS